MVRSAGALLRAPESGLAVGCDPPRTRSRSEAEEAVADCKAKLDGLDKKFDELKDKADKATGDEKVKLDAKWKDATAKREAVVKKHDELKAAAADKWEAAGPRPTTAFEEYRKKRSSKRENYTEQEHRAETTEKKKSYLYSVFNHCFLSSLCLCASVVSPAYTMPHIGAGPTRRRAEPRTGSATPAGSPATGRAASPAGTSASASPSPAAAANSLRNAGRSSRRWN